MKGFKVSDMWIQITTIVVGLLLLLFQHQMAIGESFFYSYIILGAWQVISVITHFFFPKEIKMPLRNIYHVLLALTVAGGVIIGIFREDDLLEYMYYMLFWTPILALLYLATCIIETVRLKEKN